MLEFPVRSACRGDTGHRETGGTTPERPGMPPLRSAGRPISMNFYSCTLVQ